MSKGGRSYRNEAPAQDAGPCPRENETDLLWEDGALRVAFVEKNPFKLRPEYLELARSWQHRVFAPFCIFTTEAYRCWKEQHSQRK